MDLIKKDKPNIVVKIITNIFLRLQKMEYVLLKLLLALKVGGKISRG